MKSIIKSAIKRLSLRQLLVLLFSGLVTVSVGITGLLAYYNGQQTVKEMSLRLMAETAELVRQHLDSYLEAPHLINRSNLSAAKNGLLPLDSPETLASWFWSQGHQFTGVGTIAFANAEGEFAGANVPKEYLVFAHKKLTGGNIRRFAAEGDGKSRGTVLSDRPDYDARKRKWYQTAITSTAAKWTAIEASVTEQRLDCTATVPYFDDNNSLRGVFMVDLPLNQIGEFLRSMNISRYGTVFVMERNGNLIASSTDEKTFRTTEATGGLQQFKAVESKNLMISAAATNIQSKFTNISSVKERWQTRASLGGEHQFLQVTPYRESRGIDWLIVTVIPQDTFMGHVSANNRMTATLSILALVAAITIGSFAAFWIVAPIRRLGDSAQAIAHGEWELVPSIDRLDEVGDLARAFNEMSGRLAKTFQELRESEADLACRVEERTQELETVNKALLLEIGQRAQAQEQTTLLNDELQRQKTALENANQELETFCYSVSHDLRAPLRHMSGFSALLKEEYSDKLDQSGQHLLHRISVASAHMGTLIDALLDFSRLSRKTLHYSVLSLSRIAGNLVNMLREIEPERKVDILIHEGLECKGDAHLLQIVLQNLIGNAWKYSSRNPEATIEVGKTFSQGKEAFFVRDNGVGFDMDYSYKLFKVFERLHGADFTGTGIGLATVHRIIAKHGGEVWGEAAIGKGATFYFTIPDLGQDD